MIILYLLIIAIVVVAIGNICTCLIDKFGSLGLVVVVFLMLVAYYYISNK